MEKQFNIAIVGVSGLVGSTLISLLESRNFPVGKLYVLASSQSLGKEVLFKKDKIAIQLLSSFDFSKTDIAFFCVSNDLVENYVPKAVAAGNLVIDKSSFYRNHSDVPLIVPEVNSDVCYKFSKMNIISSPNCNTIPIAVALKPIYDAVGIKRMNICTYQSVSGTGRDALQELSQQTKQLLNNEEIYPQVYSQQIAFNVLPHIDAFEENGYTREEMKMVNEIKKLFNDNDILINPTAVRVPVFIGHAAAVHIETKHKITKVEAENILSNAQGIKIFSGNLPYPTPAKDAAGNDLVHIGRIRNDISYENGLNLWVVSDNLRKGAALNAIQITEHLIKENMISRKNARSL